MKNKLLAGLAGSLVLNILHEVIRHNDSGSPRINEVGEEGLNKSLQSMNLQPIENEQKLYMATLAGDVISNTLYYALTATKNGAISGALAGVGAVYLPAKLGLNDEPVASTNKKKMMTMGYYLIGGIVTSLVYKKIKNEN